MDILIWIVLTILAVFFTILMLAVEDYGEIKGFGIVLAIVSLLSWIIVGLLAINLTYTSTIVVNGIIVDHTITYPSTWPIAIFYCLFGIFSLLIVLKKIPDVWPGVKTP